MFKKMIPQLFILMNARHPVRHREYDGKQNRLFLSLELKKNGKINVVNAKA